MQTSKAAAILASHKAHTGKFNTNKINQAAFTLGRAGGLVGGDARAASLSQKERTTIASHAANIRWGNKCGCSLCKEYA